VEAAEKEAAQWLAGNPDVCIIAADSMFPPKAFPETRDGIDGSAISAAFGVLAEKLVEQFRFPAIFITGGDTALSVCRSLSVLGIEPRAEICPGVPIGKIVGGKADAQFIITKSGRFGGENTLVEIMRYLKIPVPKESLAQSDSCQLRSIG
jgi:uncharacterized protein YgbK (DUF1537 family)